VPSIGSPQRHRQAGETSAPVWHQGI